MRPAVTMRFLILLLLATSVTSFSGGPPSCKVNQPAGQHAPSGTKAPLEVCVTATPILSNDPEKADSIAFSIVSMDPSWNFKGFRIKLANAEEDIGTWSVEGEQTNNIRLRTTEKVTCAAHTKSRRDGGKELDLNEVKLKYELTKKLAELAEEPKFDLIIVKTKQIYWNNVEIPINARIGRCF